MTNYSYSSSAPWNLYFQRSYIKSIEISDGVTSIGGYAFYDCSKFTSIEIPNSVTSIGEGAFSGCKGLTSVTIPNSVTTIGGGAFYNCSGLTSLNIPNSVTSIDTNAFYNCSGLTSITIPNSVTSIGGSTFYGCSGLTSIYLPSSIKSIGNNAFANCSELLDVYCYIRKPLAVGTNAFANSGIQFATLYVPEASVNGYKTTTPWSGFGNIKALSGEYPEIPEITKCATPTILYENGKLSFSCDTEGVRYVYNFSTPSESDESGSNISMPEKLQVTVYATKEGYEDSDVATKEVEVSGGTAGIKGDVNLDGEIGMPDVMFIVNYILNGQFPDEE